MEEITSQALAAIMRRAPVWAASMAGRTKVFTGDPMGGKAHVEGSDGRFKIIVHPDVAANPIDLEFTLLHEIAHIFRRDLVSMHKHQHQSQEINIAADCIINDTLVSMRVPAPSFAKNGCWGQDIFGFNCAGKSINELMKTKDAQEKLQNGKGKESKPGNADPNGEKVEESDGQGGTKLTEEHGGVGAGEDPCEEHRLGVDPVIHSNLKPMATSMAAYARSMFFEKGFKSKNMVTRLDWRRNRSAFAARNDVVIPRTKTTVGGNERGGPLVNLVLDVSGSMSPTWVATAAAIATEIEAAGLDFDLWLTPIRRKAKDPKQVLKALQTNKHVYDMCEEMSFPREQHWGGNLTQFTKSVKGGPSNGFIGKHMDDAKMTQSADELFALRCFETEDPVVWVYVGDYQSCIGLDMHYAPNFLHCMLIGDKITSYQKPVKEIMEREQLPRWFYKV